ncbi:aspartic peptidase domain-containing protein [Paraphoma chrysanthemicola]|nr:aspartic peptidase domain-containing protein [Paraphoma chrysanthemicola]
MSNNSAQAPSPLVIENTGRWLGNDGNWSTFFIDIGSPPQRFHVLPSFASQTVYVPIDEDCAGMNLTSCGSLRGVENFQSRPSLGFQNNASSTWRNMGIYQIGLGTELGLGGLGYFGTDTVTLSGGKSATLSDMLISTYATEDIWLGQLGLSKFGLNTSADGQQPSMISRMKADGHIPSLSFGYQAGASYRFAKVPGSLVLGGYDKARQSGDIVTIPFREKLVVGLQTIITTSSYANADTTILDNGILVALDPTVSELWLPQTLCDAFASAFNLTYVEAANRYVISNDTRSRLRDSALTIRFSIGVSRSGGKTITVEIPYAAFDLQASYPIFATPTSYFPLRRAANESQYAIGRIILSEVYVSVDWERDHVNINRAAFSSPPPAPQIVAISPFNRSAELTPSGSDTKVLSAGPIAGIVIGAVLFIAFLASLGWWLRRRRHSDSIELSSDADRTKIELDGKSMSEMYASHSETELGGNPMSEMHDSQRQPELGAIPSRSCVLRLERARCNTIGISMAMATRNLWRRIAPRQGTNSQRLIDDQWKSWNHTNSYQGHGMFGT